MKKLTQLIISVLKKITLARSPVLKLQPMEIFKDSGSDKPYVIITPIGRYKPHNIYLEDLITQKELLKKLNMDSLCYVFHTYGVLRATQNNNFFCLVEILPFNAMIKVKNVKTLQTEDWTKERFNLDYTLLDKVSLRNATEFLLACKNLDKSNDHEDSNYKIKTFGNLRLIK